MNIGITGATGQMGSTVITQARERDIDIGVAVSRSEVKESEVDVKNDDAFATAVQDNNIDVIIDFTTPEATLDYLQIATEFDIPMVIGTTGFSTTQTETIREYGNNIPVLKATNFSPSITVMRTLVREAAQKLRNYDIEVTETHHNRKNDAPSGTANTLLNDVKDVRDNIEETHGRKGEETRTQGEIGVHARRAGDIRGIHEMLLAGNDEILTIKHRVESRKVFAIGALQAAEWIQDQEPGFYEFSEVLSDGI
ncbi:MAG: 4-hydroxy-tetrahydrodipicolinate reductase [Halobacteriaceae archaeon]